MKKFFLLSVAALLLVCLSFNSCGSSGQAVLSQMNLGSKSERAAAIAQIIEDGLSAYTGDSTHYLAGVWAYTDGGSVFDTLWFYRDSTVTSHYISKKDTINLLQTGGYIYYPSFKQVLVQYDGAHNYLTKRDMKNWSITNIYNVQKVKLTLLNMNQLSLTELDQTTGENLGSTTYTYVEDVKQ